ncbi:MAG: hypothetical protein ACREU2_01875 [Steroidobacteraceae bacterium]
MRGLILLFTVAYVLSQAFDAVLRWGLNLFGAAALIYLRDYSLILVVLLGCYLLMHERRNIARTFWVLWALALGGCVSLLSGIHVPQMLFGIKVWLPFVAGFVLVETGLLGSLHRPRAWAALWLVCCAGVLINYFYRYPWTALMIQLGNVTVTGQRSATDMGVARLAGFSRANFDAAMLVLILYIYLLFSLKGAFTRALLTLVSGAVIALTTTKGAAAAFVLVLVLSPAVGMIRGPGSRLKAPLIGCLMLVALAGMLLPVLAAQYPLPPLRPHTLSNWMLASFVDRATNTWPQALALIGDWQWITGRGIGGIGAAQQVWEAGRANPADNMFIYLYVTAGLFGAALYLFYAFASCKLLLHRQMHRVMFLGLAAMFAYGMTVNIIESAVAAMALGALAGVLSAPALQGATEESVQRLVPV